MDVIKVHQGVQQESENDPGVYMAPWPSQLPHTLPHYGNSAAGWSYRPSECQLHKTVCEGLLADFYPSIP